MDAFLHFIAHGHAEGRSPHPLVDPGHIKSVDRHLLPSGGGIQQLYEMLLYDLADPSPYFMLDYYRSFLASDDDVSKGLLAHFLNHGLKRGFKPNPFLDPLWYAAHQMNEPSDPSAALRHFVIQGDINGLAPSPAFSGTRYLRRYRDVVEAQLPALAHYLTVGRIEGRACLPEENDAAQLEALIKGRFDASSVTIDAAEILSSYNSLRDRIGSFRQEKKDRVSVARPDIVHFEKLAGKASRLTFPRTRNPKISILVPFFNEVSYTVECLGAIIASKPRVSFEVILADDASSDPSLHLLAKIANLKIVRQESNVGFLENCNRAYASCNGEFLLLLNNDAQLMPGCLDAMLNALETNPTAGAVGPKILYPNGRLQEAGCTLDRDGVATMVGLFDDPTRPEYNFARDVHSLLSGSLRWYCVETTDA